MLQCFVILKHTAKEKEKKTSVAKLKVCFFGILPHRCKTYSYFSLNGDEYKIERQHDHKLLFEEDWIGENGKRI
jgi:hypothetical protein